MPAAILLIVYSPAALTSFSHSVSYITSFLGVLGVAYFSFKYYETVKLEPQRIMFGSSIVNWLPLLAESLFVEASSCEEVQESKRAAFNVFFPYTH